MATDPLGLRQYFDQAGLTPAVRPDKTYDSSALIAAARERLANMQNHPNFPQGIASGRTMQLEQSPALMVTDVGFKVGDDGYPYVDNISYRDSDGQEYTNFLNRGGPNGMTLPRAMPRPLPELKPQTGLEGLVSDVRQGGRTLLRDLFGPSQAVIASETLPSPPHWSEAQLQYFHNTGQIPPGASRDDVYYAVDTPDPQNPQLIHPAGSVKVPYAYKPWMPESTVRDYERKYNGIVGGLGSFFNPVTGAKDLVHNTNLPGLGQQNVEMVNGEGQMAPTMGNYVANVLGLGTETQAPKIGGPLPGSRYPSFAPEGYAGMPIPGAPQPQHEFVRQQYINPNENLTSQVGKVIYNLGAGTANTALGVEEFMHSPLGYATKGAGLLSASSLDKAARVGSGLAGGTTTAAQYNSAINQARLAAGAHAGLQGMFVKDLATGAFQEGQRMADLFGAGETGNALSQIPGVVGNALFAGQIARGAYGEGRNAVSPSSTRAAAANVADINYTSDMAKLDAIVDPYRSNPVLRQIDMDYQPPRVIYGGQGVQPMDPLAYDVNYRKEPISIGDVLEGFRASQLQRPVGSRLGDFESPERKALREKLAAEGATPKEVAEFDARIQNELAAEEAYRQRLYEKLKKRYEAGEQIAVGRGQGAAGARPINRKFGESFEPREKGDIQPTPGGGLSPEVLRSANEKRIDPKTGQYFGVSPATGLNLAPGLEPPMLTRGQATTLGSELARPDIPNQFNVNVELQRGVAAPTQREVETFRAFTELPANRRLVDAALAEFRLTPSERFEDTGYWVGKSASEGEYTQFNPASAFRFNMNPGENPADFRSRISRFAAALSYASGQEASAFTYVRNDIRPDRYGRYPDANNRQQAISTGLEIDLGRPLNRAETMNFSRELASILKNELGVPDQTDNIGIQGHSGGVRIFDWDNNVKDKLVLANAAKVAYERTIGSDSGQNASLRLIAYESEYEWHSREDAPKGTFGNRYAELLGVGTESGISPGLRRAIDDATQERNNAARLYSGLGSGRSKQGLVQHPQTGRPMDPSGQPVIATPLALTGDRQLSSPVRPVIPLPKPGDVGIADQIPGIGKAGTGQVSLPGSERARRAISGLGPQSAVEKLQQLRSDTPERIGNLGFVEKDAPRTFGGEPDVPLSRSLQAKIQEMSGKGVNLRVRTPQVQAGGSAFKVALMAVDKNGNEAEVSSVQGWPSSDAYGRPQMYINSFNTTKSLEGQGLLKAALSEFVHRVNAEAAAMGLSKVEYQLIDVSVGGKSTRSLASVVGPEATFVDTPQGSRNERYFGWRKGFEQNKLLSAENDRKIAEVQALLDANAQAYEDGKVDYDSYFQRKEELTSQLNDLDMQFGDTGRWVTRPSFGAAAVSRLGNRSLPDYSFGNDTRPLEDRLADTYDLIDKLQEEMQSGSRNPNRVQSDIDSAKEMLEQLLAEQDKSAGAKTVEERNQQTQAQPDILTQKNPHQPGTPAYNNFVMRQHFARMELQQQQQRSVPNQSGFMPPRAEVEIMRLRRFMRDVSDGKVSTGEAGEVIQRAIDRLVNKTSIKKERALSELGKIEGIDPAFIEMASRKFDERDAPKPEPVKGGTSGRERVRDPLAKPQVWERRQERTGAEALAETGDPSRLTYDELIDLQNNLERNKGSADPELLRSVVDELESRHRQFGNEGERNTALGGFVPETTSKSQLNQMVRELPDKIRSDKATLSELNRRDGRNRSEEAQQLAKEIKVNEERLRAAKVELNARARQQGNWQRTDRSRIVERERDKKTFETPGVEPRRVKRDPVQALNWSRGRFDRLTIDELIEARERLKKEGRPYWKEIDKAINERRKAMPEMRKEEGRPTDIVPENLTRAELESQADSLRQVVEQNDFRANEMSGAGATPEQVAEFRAQADAERGRLSEIEGELEKRDTIETTDFREENRKQIGGHEQFRVKNMSLSGDAEIVGPTEGGRNKDSQFWYEQTKYSKLSAGEKNVAELINQGRSKVRDILQRIVDNSKSKDYQGIDPQLGKLAEFLLKNQDARTLDTVVGSESNKESAGISFYTTPWRPEAPGLSTGTKYGSIIYDRETLSSAGRIIEVVMHEIMHAATAMKVNRAIFGTVNIQIGGETGDVVGSTGTKYVDRLKAYVRNPNADRSVSKLVQTYLKVLSMQTDPSKPINWSRLEASNDWERVQGPEGPGFSQVMAESQNIGPGSDIRTAAKAGQYPISDLNEFISHAMTHKDFQKYLSGIKMGESNAWTRFKDSVKQILGIEPGDTALSHAMDSILDISSRELSDFRRPDAQFYSDLYAIREERLKRTGFEEGDASAMARAEVDPRGLDSFGIGQQSNLRGLNDVEADIEQLRKKAEARGGKLTGSERSEMRQLEAQRDAFENDYERITKLEPAYKSAEADLRKELGRRPTFDEVMQELDFRERNLDEQGKPKPGEYNYRQLEADRRRLTGGKTEQELDEQLRSERDRIENTITPEMEAEIEQAAREAMDLTPDTLEAMGGITREQRIEKGEFKPGSPERRDELFQAFVEMGGDTDTRLLSEIPSDVQDKFKERFGFQYNPEDIENLGEPRLGGGDTRSLGNKSIVNRNFLRREAQAAVNAVEKGVEGLRRVKEDITDSRTFAQTGVDVATASFLRASQAQLDVLASRTGSRTLRRVSELLNSSLPGRTDKAVSLGFHTAVSNGQLKFKNTLAQTLRPFKGELELMSVDKQKEFLEDLGRDIVRPGLPSDPARAKAVTELRKLYRDLYNFQIRAGIKLENAGETYVPRMLDNERVLKDRSGFLNAAQRAYETTGLDPVEARDAAAQWWDSILRGDSGFTFDQKFVFDSSNLNGEPKHTRSRKFNKVAESFLEPYYNRNIFDATQSYIGRAVKNAEIARRFGAEFELYRGFEQDLIDEGNRSSLREMNTLVASQLGTNQLKDVTGQGVINFLNAYSAIHFLPRATISSLSEPIVNGMRTGNITDSLTGLGNSLRYMRRKLFDSDPDYFHQLASDIGVVVSELAGQSVSSSVNSRYWHDQTRSAGKFFTDRFFRLTGLHQWTEATRIASVRTGTVFIERLADDIINNGRMRASSARYLNELGVADHMAFSRFVMSLKGKSEADRLAAINSSKGKGPKLYREALAKFAEQVIMNPNAGTRPRWANHPLGSVIFNLQSYLYAFHENVTKRTARLAKTAMDPRNELKAMDRMHMLGPAMMFPVLAGFQYLIGEPRDELFKDPAKRYDDPTSTGIKIARALSRSNAFGRYDFAVNGALSARYDKDPATVMLGPVLGSFSEGIKAGVEYAGSKNSPNTNTAERRLARMGYDLGIQPALNLGFSAAPGKILGTAGAVGIQAGSHPAVREQFVEGMAGPPVNPKKRPQSTNLIDELLSGQ